MFAILRYVYFLRYPLLFGLLLILIAPVSIAGFPKRLLGNVFLVHNLSQTASLTVVCFCMATVLAAQVWIVHENGKHRFADLGALPSWLRSLRQPTTFWRWSLVGTLLWLLAAFCAPLTTVWHSWATRAANPIDSQLFPANVNHPDGVLGIVGGALISLGMLLVLSLVNVYFDFTTAGRSFLPFDGLASWLLRRTPGADPTPARFPFSVLARLISGPRELNTTRRNGYAYTNYQNASDKVGSSFFEPGHMQLGVLVLLLVGVYFAYLFVSPASERALQLDEHWFGTSFFLMVLLLFAVNALAAAAFFCDGFRLPPVVLVVLVLAWAYSDLDHTFPVTHSQESPFAQPSAQTAPAVVLGKPTPLIKVQQSLPEISKGDLPNQIYGKSSRRPHEKDADKYLIVITAPGGGIHAAGWTSQVLTGLHKRYGAKFSKSIGLISAVSGGSVGAMHYANSFERLDDSANHPNLGNEVVADSCSSSLEAVGWGLAYEDLPRVLPLRLLRSEELDRSLVVEALWNSQLKRRNPSDKPPTLRDWWQRREAGTCPPLVFNATEVESGRRVLFGNIELPRSLQEVASLGIESRQFFEVFPQGDLEVATAARLSATFPYVFPAAKHQIPVTETVDGESDTKHYGFGHVVDGGYSDNEGIITAVEVIKELIQKRAEPDTELTFNKVLLIRIQHHAVKKQSMNPQRAPIPVSSWRAAFAGPMQAVLSVRDTSQVERAAIETDLLKHMKEVSAFPIQTVYLEFVPDDLVGENPENAIVFDGHEDQERDGHDCQLSIAADNSSSRKRSNYQSPLSWKLTPQEFEQYGKCWENHEKKAQEWGQRKGPRPALALLDEIFAHPTH